MCGILLVKSAHPIPLEQHLAALRKLESRGPDFSRYQYKNNIFIAQAVLHITGTNDYYNQQHTNFLAYNGEIYNYQDLGAYANDIEFVDDAVNNNPERLKDGWGPWAWAWTNGTTVRYAADPQGEKTLYQYQDDNILIVCSEVAPILEYIKAVKLTMDYSTRHWAILEQTPWTGITRVTPGKMYMDGKPNIELDSVWNWIAPATYNNIDEAYEEFKSIWQHTLELMTPACAAALTYSGGLDSSIILSHIDNLELYTTDMLGKDPIASGIVDFLTPVEQTRLHKLEIDPELWAQQFCAVIRRTQMPVQSWSFVGQWAISESCEQRVLFTGAGADELFGGYNLYQQLNYSTEYSVSPYSQNCDGDLWKKCLTVYDQHAGQATMLADYWHQIAGCDVRGIDSITGAWGIEGRNPFIAKPVMQFALNLPFEFKVGATTKPLIQRLFLERWKEKDILPKKGFTGHCNDALPWLGIDIDTTGNRDQDWHRIVLKSFYTDSTQPGY